MRTLRIATALVFALAVHGQTSRGTVTGTVLDQSGAVIRGARVRLAGVDTGAKLSTMRTIPVFIVSMPSTSASTSSRLHMPGFGIFAAPESRSRRIAPPHSGVIEVNPTNNQIVWKYQEASADNFYSSRISNAQRLPNGNTLINEGLFGRFFEVTSDSEVVWEYVNPYFGPATRPAQAQTNSVFRAYRYTEEQIARARNTA